MDLRLYARVLWRFRWVVVGGWMLAVVLAFFSFTTIGADGFSYRQAELWSASEDLNVTQAGFAAGRAILPSPEEARGADDDGPPQFADPGRLAELATTYVELATSDGVYRLVAQSGPIDGELAAIQFTDASGDVGLPLLRLTATAPTAEAAVALVQRHSDAFREFIRAGQQRAQVPKRQRVFLDVLRQADSAERVTSRSLTTPAVIFLAILIGTAGLVFLLENLMPHRGHPSAATPPWASPRRSVREPEAGRDLPRRYESDEESLPFARRP